MRNELLALCGVALLCVGCKSSSSTAVTTLPREQISRFTCSDQKLEHAYEWARGMALSYAHDGEDPVGCWYEAALPMREAFCMRDVSHQSVGAHILGLQRHTKNMMHRFAENISESKDWCTYWEINRYNRPAPADYDNDNEFWYNLNANFDVIFACLKMYDWTADEDYLSEKSMRRFYELSAEEYAERWMLRPDKIMNRPRYMNAPENFDPSKNFHTCRGLGSYVENFRDLTVGVDLVAALYAGYKAFAQMNETLGHEVEARKYFDEAKRYRDLLETRWWNEKGYYYNSYWTQSHEFCRGDGSPLVLWFEATENPDRIRATVKEILAKKWNVENLSSFPMLFYRLGYDREALECLGELPSMPRSEYPEVSYGVVEGIVSGMMGLLPNARENKVVTLSRLPDDKTTATVENVPVFGGYVSLSHVGYSQSTLTNNTGREMIWEVNFAGEFKFFEISGAKVAPQIAENEMGKRISTLRLIIKQGQTIQVKALS